MPRRIVLAAVLAGAAAFGVYWWLTAPPVVPAVAAPAYTPNPANGLTTFNAGGCSSCHAVPGQPDRTRLGGGLAIPSPFGTFYVPEHLARSGRRHRAMDRGRIRQRGDARGFRRSGMHYFPAFPYTSYAARQDRRHPRPLRLSEDACAGARQGARSRRAVSVQHQAQYRDLEIAVHGRQAVHAGRGALGAVESRRLSRQQPRPLRGVSQPAQFPRRHRRLATLRRRTQSGRRGLGAEHHAKRTWRLEREGHRLFPRNRTNARWRQRRRLDGARDQEHSRN